MSSASPTTAPSTQPPLTEPATSPSSLTAIAAPGSRGPDPSMLTTRATATRRPPARQRSMSSSTSRMGYPRSNARDGSGQLFQRGQRMTFHEVINIRQRRRHPSRQWRITRGDLQRVDPDDVEGDPLQTLHLLGQSLRISTVPAVAEDDHDRAASHAAHTPLVVERT